MESMMHIGNIVNKEVTQLLSKAIQDTLESGFKNHMSDTVMVKALDVVQGAFKVEHVTVTNSVFTDKSVYRGRRKEDEGSK